MSRAILLLAGLALARPASAQPVLTAHGGTIFSSAAAQEVATTTGTDAYQMFLVRDGYQILSATSPDMASWSLQSGVRLSTSPDVAALDYSSITSCGVIASTATNGFQRLYYVGISSAGFYAIASATSTDGLDWGKETGFSPIRVSNGRGFLNSPKPLVVSSSVRRLFYVADSAGGNTPSNYRIYSASSTDGGLTWTAEGQVLSDQAYAVSPVTLTDGRFRLYYTSYSGAVSTPTLLLSAISADGRTFTKESGTSLSTTAPSGLWDVAVVRSTESFRWRLYSTYNDSISSVPFVSSATTLTPYITSVSPAMVFKNAGPTAFTLNGEVLSPNLAIAFNQATSTIAWTSVSRTNDLQASGTADPTGRALGNWNAVVTNADGRQGTGLNVLLIDVPPGSVTITDNLFRPTQGGRASIALQVFDTGRATARLYTIDGAFIATLFDGVISDPGTTFTWNGTNGAGATVASGVYLLKVKGPKINSTEKIVVIK